MGPPKIFVAKTPWKSVLANFSDVPFMVSLPEVTVVPQRAVLVFFRCLGAI